MLEVDLDLSRAHLLRMALAVKEDEASRPIYIRLLGADCRLPNPDGVAQAVEQARRRQRYWRFGRRRDSDELDVLHPDR
jgi:hypothetical protein